MMHPRKGEFFSSRVRYISLNQIRPNPQQPRRSFDEDSLSELAESIRSYGILQPLTVRRQGTGYELVAGERRLRAAAMAGLREVPCLVAQVGEEDSALLALMENLQRRDLDCWEEAEALSRLIARYGLSQEETARRLGRSQPAVANKLRLLRLPDSVRRFLQENNLTERHARALLRLGTEEQQLAAAQVFCRRRMNVAAAETYAEGSAAPPAGDATQGPYYLYHQGCPAVPQQRGPGPAPDAPGGSQRRLGPSGHRRGDPSDHPYSQAGADIMRRSV